MSGQVASRLGFKDRGLIKKSYWADICVFNFNNIHEKATYDKPHQYSDGMDYVLVNGKIVLDPNGSTGLLPGKVLSA